MRPRHRSHCASCVCQIKTEEAGHDLGCQNGSTDPNACGLCRSRWLQSGSCNLWCPHTEESSPKHELHPGARGLMLDDSPDMKTQRKQNRDPTGSEGRNEDGSRGNTDPIQGGNSQKRFKPHPMAESPPPSWRKDHITVPRDPGTSDVVALPSFESGRTSGYTSVKSGYTSVKPQSDPGIRVVRRLPSRASCHPGANMGGALPPPERNGNRNNPIMLD